MAKMPIWIRMLNAYALTTIGAKQISTTPTMAALRLAVVGKIVLSAA